MTTTNPNFDGPELTALMDAVFPPTTTPEGS